MLWLVGLMGSGKSTIGPLAADLLGVPFLDTDALVESTTGRSIPELFEEGVGAFRSAESDVIAAVAGGEPAVVASGGGAVISMTNRDRMRSSGAVVWLRATTETLAARIGGTEGRPLLDEGADRSVTLAELAHERRAAYQGVAGVIIDTDEMAIEEIVEEVVAAWPAS